jgi:hypothetical protein
MEEIDFTLDGARYRLTRDAVIGAMKKQIPGRIQTYAVNIEGVRFPVKQVLAQALQIPLTSFVSTRAQDLLRKLEFEVVNVELEAGDDPAEASTRQRALELAISFSASRPDVNGSDVIDIAERFTEFLERSHG